VDVTDSPECSGNIVALATPTAIVSAPFFPMPMRGVQPTFTDLMHGVLAIDPFLLAAVVLGALAFRGRFRVYTIVTIVFTTVLAVIGFSYVSAVVANEPTPWMGAIERASQYAMNLWYAALAVLLLRQHDGHERPAVYSRLHPVPAASEWHR
jgi:hypothetical protein